MIFIFRHPTSCASAAEIMSVLFFNTMRYDPRAPRDPNSDRFVLSKGHAGPVLYSAWVEAGYIKPEEILKMRQLDSDLEGHPTPVSSIFLVLYLLFFNIFFSDWNSSTLPLDRSVKV